MEKSEIELKLEPIFRSTLNDSSLILHDGLTANDVAGWDSLTHMVLITNIEETFNIKFRLKELNKMRNVGVLIDLIQTKL